jgi:hypothetical protein
MSFTCPRCGAVSHHPKDKAHGYCGRCHEFTGDPSPCPHCKRDDGTHDAWCRYAADTTQAELQLWYDLRRAADKLAVAKWRAANPEQELVIPDHADLVIWLLDQLAVTSPCPHCKRSDGLHESGCPYAVVAARIMRVDHALAKRVGEMIERNSKFRTHIEKWLAAYPLDIFPEPDMAKAADALKAAGQTLDAVSASNMRHVLQRLLEFIDDPAAFS